MVNVNLIQSLRFKFSFIPLGFAYFIVVGLVGLSCDTYQPNQQVVVYTSLDQHYSQPILKQFEKETGIKVLDRYDTEADKTTGLFNRLIQEKNNPRCDVFWNSEVLRMVLLAKQGVLEKIPEGVGGGIPKAFHAQNQQWVGFAARYRVLIYNTEQVKEADAPRSILELVSKKWEGQAAVALPLAGTTQTHFGALQAVLGKKKMGQFIQLLIENKVRFVNGNAVVRDLVAQGTVAIGLTDTDDANEGIKKGSPLKIVFPDQEKPPKLEKFDHGLTEPLGSFLIPNTVAQIKGGKNPEAAKKLIDYLLSAKIETQLAQSGSVQIPLRPGLDPPEGIPHPSTLKLLKVSFEQAAQGVEDLEPVLKDRFLR